MSHWNRSKWGWFFAPDKGAGSGGPQETEDETPDNQVEETEEESEESGDADEEESEGESTGTEDAAEDAKEEAKPRELTDEEIAERAAALGFVKPEVKPEPAADAKSLDIDVPDFRTQAYEAVVQAANAKAKGWVDEDGDMTEAGQMAAENYALQLAADHRLQSVESEREKLEIQANRTQYVDANVKFLKENEHFKLDESLAASVGKTMTDILVDSYGPMALKPKTPQDVEVAKRLWSTAYYTALGIEAHNARLKAQEGGDKNDAAPVEKPKGNIGPGSYEGVAKEDREFFEKEYVPRLQAKYGKDYKPTKADIEKFKELINR